MGEALRLTRAGQLAEATSLLQHGLGGQSWRTATRSDRRGDGDRVNAKRSADHTSR